MAPPPAPEPLSVEVRPPREAELPACRRLLPAAFQRGVLPDMLLATTTEPLRFVGAAAYELVSLRDNMAWSVLLEVVPTSRRRGVGTRMIRSLADRGQACGIRELIVRHDVKEQASAAEFLRSLGFRHSLRMSMYRINASDYYGMFEPLRQRLVERDKVPTSTRVAGLREVSWDAVLRFHAAHIAQATNDVEVPWPKIWSRKSMLEASVVLLDGDQVIGLGLTEVSGDQAYVHYRVVSPEHRGGWANIVLGAEMGVRVQASGVRQVEFTATSQTPDTQAIIERDGMQFLKAQDRYVLPLDPE